MKRIFSILSAAAVLFAVAPSCQTEEGPAQEQAKFEISNYTIAESAEFGETLDFSVTAKTAQNVTVALIKDAKQYSSVTVREAVENVFAGTIAIPYGVNPNQPDL